MPLPPFLFETQVTKETAKQDHIQVTLDNWVIRGTAHDIDALRHRMAAPPESQRHGNAENVMATWGRLFNRPNQQGANRRPLVVRGEPLTVGGESLPPPLFSGKWRFGRHLSEDSVERDLKTSLDLHLNPTRYVRHQSVSPLPSIAASAPWPEPRLYACKGAAEIDGEAVLNNADNWLPQTARWMAFSNPARWKRHLKAYLDSITGELGREIERINAISPTARHEEEDPEDFPMFNLHVVEHYWEFSSEDPTALVGTLEPLLKSFSAYCEAVSFPIPPTVGAFHNSLCLKAKAGQGREIRIYAKTYRRVRVEVVHYLKSPNGFVVQGGKTGFWHELSGRLEVLAEDAAELVNRMFLHFRTHKNVTPSHIAPYLLLMEIVRDARDFSTAITIVSVLLRLGRVAAEGGGEKMQAALQKLSRAGVLEYLPRTKAYVVTPPRRHALQMLKDHGDFPMLVARVRRRPLQ